MPVTVSNLLTNQRWVLATAPNPMTFSNYPPGDYSLLNDTGSSANVLLWGGTYAVPANSTWRFMSHSDLENIAVSTKAVPQPGKPGKPRYAVESTHMKVWPPDEPPPPSPKPEPKTEAPKEAAPAEHVQEAPRSASPTTTPSEAERARHETARAAASAPTPPTPPKPEPKLEPKPEPPKTPNRRR